MTEQLARSSSTGRVLAQQPYVLFPTTTTISS